MLLRLNTQMVIPNRTEGCELDILCDRLSIPIPWKMGYSQSGIHLSKVENGHLDKYPVINFLGRDAIKCDRSLREPLHARVVMQSRTSHRRQHAADSINI